MNSNNEQELFCALQTYSDPIEMFVDQESSNGDRDQMILSDIRDKWT